MHTLISRDLMVTDSIQERKRMMEQCAEKRSKHEHSINLTALV